MRNLFDNNSGADFSADGKHRYSLWRIWNDELPKVMCIGFNPSTANSIKNDQTITYLLKMFSLLGYGGFYMVNCWTYITSKPENLKTNELNNEWNDNMITITASKCKDVVFAWGGFKVIQDKERDKQLQRMFPKAKCFGKNKDGSPIHPLGMMPRNGRDPNKPILILYNGSIL